MEVVEEDISGLRRELAKGKATVGARPQKTVVKNVAPPTSGRKWTMTSSGLMYMQGYHFVLIFMNIVLENFDVLISKKRAYLS